MGARTSVRRDDPQPGWLQEDGNETLFLALHRSPSCTCGMS